MQRGPKQETPKDAARDTAARRQPAAPAETVGRQGPHVAMGRLAGHGGSEEEQHEREEETEVYGPLCQAPHEVGALRQAALPGRLAPGRQLSQGEIRHGLHHASRRAVDGEVQRQPVGRPHGNARQDGGRNQPHPPVGRIQGHAQHGGGLPRTGPEPGGQPRQARGQEQGL